MRAQHRRNFQFFDAPVGMVFTIHRGLATGSWLDYGMFLENIMIAARARGLDTCAQAAWTHYHRVMRPVLGLTPGGGRGLWHGPGLCRPGRAGERAGDRAGGVGLSSWTGGGLTRSDAEHT